MQDEIKICPKCKSELPATDEFFYRGKPSAGTGFIAPCKKCRLLYRKMRIKKMKAQRDIVRVKWKDDIRAGKIKKICPHCKQKLPLIEKFFRRNKKYISGFTCWCKKCEVLYRNSRKEKISKYITSYYSTFNGAMVHALNSARTRARKSGRECTVDMEYLLQLWDKQEGRCAITGIKMSYGWNDLGTGWNGFGLEERDCAANRRHPHNMSLDRINNELGYVPDNVRFVTVLVNLALNNFGEKVFDEMCRNRVDILNQRECNPVLSK